MHANFINIISSKKRTDIYQQYMILCNKGIIVKGGEFQVDDSRLVRIPEVPLQQK